MKHKPFLATSLAIVLSSIAIGTNAQLRENTNWIDSVAATVADVKEEVVKIKENYYSIQPYGLAGNIGVFVSDGGVVLVDDQWAILAKRIKELIATVTPKQVTTIINTHYHFDHTNGNLAFGPDKVSIVAHKNARTRMSEKQVGPPPTSIVQKAYPSQALPTVTFTDRSELHAGGETIELTYHKGAHTDGDIIVHFKSADIYHTGDIFVTYGLPFIDERAGGDIYGIIEAVDWLLASSNENTRFIPGHGAVCTKKDLQAYRDLLATVRDNVATMHRQKRKPEDIIKETVALIHYENKGAEGFIAQAHRAAMKRESSK